MSDLFVSEVARMRRDVALVTGQSAPHFTTEVCRCNAYGHPHRYGGGRCTGHDTDDDFGFIDDLDRINAEELYLHDANEADAINRSR